MSDYDSDEEAARQMKDYREIQEEIEQYKKNPETASMFVSGWDDADQDVDEVKDPKANPVDHVLWAAENAEMDTLKQLLSTQPGLVHARDSDGYTPLHRAAYKNNISVICCLLSYGAKVTAKTELGWTPLHSACNWGNYLAVARLLAAGADAKAHSDGDQTPLHLSCAMSHCKSTLLVLFLRDDITEIAQQKNNSGEIPHQLASRHGIYAPLFEMILPSVSYIKSAAFTFNPYTRSNANKSISS